MTHGSAAQVAAEPRLTSLSHGGGCGCKIAPGVLSEILKDTARLPLPPELLVGIARCGNEVRLPVDFAAADRALLTDPQTSGGLLVSCAPRALDQVLAVFGRHGFDQAAVVGEVGGAGSPAGLVLS